MQMGRKRGGRGKFDFVSFQSTMAQLPHSGSMFEGLLSGFVGLKDTFGGKTNLRIIAKNVIWYEGRRLV